MTVRLSATRKTVLTFLAAATAGMILSSGSAHATDGRVKDHRAATRPSHEIHGTGPALHPEGVAWDPIRQAFLIGSARNGAVSIVNRDGTTRTLAQDPRGLPTLGLKVDVVRRRVVVVYADVNPSSPTRFTRSGLTAYDLHTGRILFDTDLATAPGPHFANDVVLDPAGNAYVTDSLSDTLYKVDLSGRASVAARDARFTAAGVRSGIGQNGIVWHPAGFLLVSNRATGKLYKVQGGRVSEVKLDRLLIGADGMMLRPDGSMIVVTNALFGDGVNAVQELRPNRWGDWSAARTVRYQAWPVPMPTTLTLTPRGYGIISGRLDILINGGTDNTFIIRRYR